MTHINFRPHHLMCTLGFKGMGYSPSFVKNYSYIYKILHDSPDTLIEIVPKNDDICLKCPNLNIKNGCKDYDKVNSIDFKHMQVLQINYGDKISWIQAKEFIKNKMTIEKFNIVCASCEWKKYGVCEESLNELLAS